MTKTLREDLQQSIALLYDHIEQLETRITGLTARIEWMQINEAERARTLAVQAPRRRPLLNGSWPQRDGNTYPRIEGKPPIGGYESYVRRSPPAKE